MTDYYKRSLEVLKSQITVEPDLTRYDWDKFANENCLFSAFTMYAHLNVNNFEELKKVVGNKKTEKDILKRIKACRKKLDKSISKNGSSSKITRDLSDEMDEMINEYYKTASYERFPDESTMNEFFEKSYEALKKITKDFDKFPTVSEWNQYAKENDYLSNISIEYISKLNWKYLKTKVEREINFKIL